MILLESAKIKLSPASINTPNASAVFNFSVKKKAPVGQQQLTFTGQDSSGRTRTAVVTLTVQ